MRQSWTGSPHCGERFFSPWIVVFFPNAKLEKKKKNESQPRSRPSVQRYDLRLFLLSHVCHRSRFYFFLSSFSLCLFSFSSSYTTVRIVQFTWLSSIVQARALLLTLRPRLPRALREDSQLYLSHTLGEIESAWSSKFLLQILENRVYKITPFEALSRAHKSTILFPQKYYIKQ